VFSAAILAGAAAIIVAHNHPSGDPTPSADDRAVTRQLVDAGRLLDLPVYDHVVLAGDRYLSFAEAGLLVGPTPTLESRFAVRYPRRNNG
jgi:DNA repair protein RadC